MNEVIRAVISGGVAALVAASATIAALSATSIDTTTLTATNSTSTIAAVGSLKVNRTDGTFIDGIFVASQNVDVDSLGVGQSTTTVVTVTGLTSGDLCFPSVTAGDLHGTTTSTAALGCRAGANAATITIRNATGTGAFNAGMSTIKVLGVSP